MRITKWVDCDFTKVWTDRSGEKLKAAISLHEKLMTISYLNEDNEVIKDHKYNNVVAIKIENGLLEVFEVKNQCWAPAIDDIQEAFCSYIVEKEIFNEN